MISLLSSVEYHRSLYFVLASSSLNLMVIVSTNCLISPLCGRLSKTLDKAQCSCRRWCAIVRNSSSHFVNTNTTIMKYLWCLFVPYKMSECFATYQLAFQILNCFHAFLHTVAMQYLWLNPTKNNLQDLVWILHV